MSSKAPVQRTFKHDFRVFLAWPRVCNVCCVYTSRLRLRANERNNSQQCWELLRTCWQRCANWCNNSQQCWDLQCIVGRIQPISICKPCIMSVRGPSNVGGACANGSNIVALRFGDHGTKEMLGVVGQQCCTRLHGAWHTASTFDVFNGRIPIFDQF